jgi:glucuronate isomerase
MMRFREQTTETAGFYNTVSFNDDTRAFLSIPSRHDVAGASTVRSSHGWWPNTACPRTSRLLSRRNSRTNSRRKRTNFDRRFAWDLLNEYWQCCG